MTERGNGAAAERRRHYRLMRRIYALLDSGEWRVRYRRIAGEPRTCARLGVGLGTVGTVDDEEYIIYVDFRDEVLATLVHECLHVLLEGRYTHRQHDEEEAEVRRLEALVMRHMTATQARRLHLAMTNVLE